MAKAVGDGWLGRGVLTIKRGFRGAKCVFRYTLERGKFWPLDTRGKCVYFCTHKGQRLALADEVQIAVAGRPPPTGATALMPMKMWHRAISWVIAMPLSESWLVTRVCHSVVALVPPFGTQLGHAVTAWGQCCGTLSLIRPSLGHYLAQPLDKCLRHCRITRATHKLASARASLRTRAPCTHAHSRSWLLQTYELRTSRPCVVRSQRPKV